MCGLVGMVGTLEWKHKKAMAELLYLDTLRGRDSTGLAAVKRDRSVITRKMTVPGYEFIEYPAVGQMMAHNDQLWIGHNRFKTTGEINKANAHPFEILDDEGDIILIGAHNGTLHNKYEIERIVEKKFDTDSEGLFHLLTHAATFKDAISRLDGAWSLVFWDPTADSINFCRNKERPLVFAFTKDRKVMVWASEAWMILAACRRNDVELETNDKGLSCYSTSPDCLYTMEIPQARDQRLPDLKREEGYTGQVSRFRSHQQHWWGEEDDGVRYGTTGKSVQSEEQEATKKRAEEAEAAEREDEKKIITLGLPPGTRRGYDGQHITQEEFDKIKEAGCGWCGDPIERIWGFIEEKVMVCKNCLQDTHPKDGDRVRSDNDDPPFDLNPKSENSEEHKRLVAASVGAAKASVG